jgi:hypothetical protein
MSKVYKNWTVHNLIGHPVSELAYLFLRPFGLVLAQRISKTIHDATLPKGHNIPPIEEDE